MTDNGEPVKAADATNEAKKGMQYHLMIPTPPSLPLLLSFYLILSLHESGW